MVDELELEVVWAVEGEVVVEVGLLDDADVGDPEPEAEPPSPLPEPEKRNIHIGQSLPRS